MKTRKIETVLAPRAAHMVGDGFRVHNFIPSMYPLSRERMSPFIMLDYNSKFYFPPSDQPRGVDVHPHRGFETVTIAYKGRVAHHDSAGNSGIIGEGDVQWMTAASGILHKEYHEKEYSARGGFFQMVQLWVNLPAKNKMSAPKYQEITNQNMQKVELADKQGTIEVIAGNYNGATGPAATFTTINLMNANLNTGGKAAFSFPVNHNTSLLVIEGTIIVNNSRKVEEDHFVLFENNGEDFNIEAITNAKVLVLSGEPIEEPIASHGPFVMNTKEEIDQAFDDFYSGKFGRLD